MALEPAGHRLLVAPDKVEDKDGSIFLSPLTMERRKSEKIFGTVLKVGRTAFRAFDDGEPWCKVGDHVAFAKFAGAVVEDPETKEQFRLLQDEDIILVHTKEEV